MQNENFSDKKLSSNKIAEPLGLLCIAIYDFAVLKKNVEPLEKNVKNLQEKLNKAEQEYKKIEGELNICKQKFDTLQKEFDDMNMQKIQLQNQIDESKVKLERAGKLIYLLSDEGKRWEESVEMLKIQQKTLLGDVFLSSSYISYMGPLSSIYRDILQ